MDKKLELKKKTISVLSNEELQTMNGGDAAPVTTSFGSCTGFTCCEDGDTGTGITTIISIVISVATAGTFK